MSYLIIKEFKDITGREFSILPVCLIAHPEFALNYGVAYYQRVQKKCQERFSAREIRLGIACQDSPTLALEAIAAQVDQIYFLKNSPYWPKIVSMCFQANILIADQQELIDLW